MPIPGRERYPSRLLLKREDPIELYRDAHGVIEIEEAPRRKGHYAKTLLSGRNHLRLLQVMANEGTALLSERIVCRANSAQIALSVSER